MDILPNNMSSGGSYLSNLRFWTQRPDYDCQLDIGAPLAGELADGYRMRLALGPRLIIFEDFPGLLACEPPVDFYPMSVLVSIPDSSFPLQLS